MNRLDLEEWVDLEEGKERKRVKSAMHIILKAISSNHLLHEIMVLKGGVLIDLEFKSHRHTKDLDFSSSVPREDFNETMFIDQLNESLLEVSTSDLGEYGLLCKCQSHKWTTKKEDSNFPAIKAKIGYADRTDTKQIRRLEICQSLNVIEIDYSFNEPLFNVEFLKSKGLGPLKVYSISDLVSEKMRSILQQEARNRYRRQDVYDLFHILSTREIDSDHRKQILQSLLGKCVSRNISPAPNSFDDPVIRARAQNNYNALADEISGPLPDFAKAYTFVSDFCKSLPWDAPA